jgi:hypothetical protein
LRVDVVGRGQRWQTQSEDQSQSRQEAVHVNLLSKGY